MSYTEAQKAKAREHLVKSKLYKGVAVGFLIVGVFIFAIFYQMFAAGSVVAFLTNPFLIGMILFPLLPAYAFALMSKIRRRKAAEVLKEGAVEAGDMDKQRTDLYSSNKL